jgi:hypothetical protein
VAGADHRERCHFRGGRMNRREFLRSLAVAGMLSGVAARSLATASEKAIDRLWQHVGTEPHVFYVRDESPCTLTTEPGYNAEVDEMIAAWGDDGAGICPMDCATGQGRAMTFFYHWEETTEFDIRLVDGDCPGSSYFGAELCSSIEEANQIAIDLDLPIRFAWQGV